MKNIFHEAVPQCQILEPQRIKPAVLRSLNQRFAGRETAGIGYNTSNLGARSDKPGNSRRTNSAASGLFAILFLAVCILWSGCGDLDSDTDTIAIGSALDLAKIGGDPAYPLDGNYYLSANIILPDSPAWRSIGAVLPFSGTFDGRSYTIRNLKLDEGTGAYPDRVIGLFGRVYSAHIKNLTIELADSETNPIILSSPDEQYVGAAAGYGERTTFEGITVRLAGNTGSISIRKPAGSVYAGGIAGKLDRGSVIKNSYSLAALNAEAAGGVYAGGLAGGNDGFITNSYSAGDVSAESDTNHAAYAGGITGINNAAGAIKNVYTGGNISVKNSGDAFAGGIAGAAVSDAIEYTAVLGAAIHAVGGSAQNAGRITGTTRTLGAANFALDAMTLETSTDPAVPGTPAPITEVSSDDENGADKSLTDMETQETYSDPISIGLGWDFTAIWEWDSNANRPQLKQENGSTLPAIPGFTRIPGKPGALADDNRAG